MKKLFQKTWFRILFFGALIGAVLIVVDNRFDLFSKKDNGQYNGAISIDKNKTYFTTVRFAELSYDFGKVKEGDTVSHAFKLQNKGKDPLFIYKVVGSCDCIGAQFNDAPLGPDEESEIMVKFKTIGRKGKQTRTLLVNTNTDPSEITLTITGEVE
jgi:hypothetical protein